MQRYVAVLKKAFPVLAFVSALLTLSGVFAFAASRPPESSAPQAEYLEMESSYEAALASMADFEDQKAKVKETAFYKAITAKASLCIFAAAKTSANSPSKE